MNELQQVIAFIDNMNNLESQGAPIDWRGVCSRVSAQLKTLLQQQNSPDNQHDRD